jgi:hypothetical protein
MPSHCEGNLPRSRENRGLTGQKRRSKQRAIEHKLRKAQEDLRQLQQAAPTLQAVPTAPLPPPPPPVGPQRLTRELKQLHDRRAGAPLGFHDRIARAAAGSFRTLARAIRHKEQDLTIGPEQYAQICIREKAAARAAARQQERLAREVSQTPAAAALSSVNSGDPFAELLALPSQAELDFQQFISCESPLF